MYDLVFIVFTLLLYVTLPRMFSDNSAELLASLSGKHMGKGEPSMLIDEDEEDEQKNDDKRQSPLSKDAAPSVAAPEPEPSDETEDDPIEDEAASTPPVTPQTSKKSPTSKRGVVFTSSPSSTEVASSSKKGTKKSRKTWSRYLSEKLPPDVLQQFWDRITEVEKVPKVGADTHEAVILTIITQIYKFLYTACEKAQEDDSVDTIGEQHIAFAAEKRGSYAEP